MKVLMVAALVIWSSATLAQTKAQSDTTGATAAPAKVKPPKPICRNEATTGSIFSTRTCYTKEDWVAIDAANAANIERMRSSRSVNGRN